jgi:uncharacterized protein YutE (UPF0331/DUF86 family)
MIAAAVLTAKLADISSRLTSVRKHRAPDADAYASNHDARDLVAFNLMLAVQSAADLALHIVSDEGLTAVQTVGEAFSRLGEHCVLEPALATRLRRAVSFRNLVAHGYAQLNLQALHEAATLGVDDLERYAQSIASWATRPTP